MFIIVFSAATPIGRGRLCNLAMIIIPLCDGYVMLDFIHYLYQRAFAYFIIPLSSYLLNSNDVIFGINTTKATKAKGYIIPEINHNGP